MSHEAAVRSPVRQGGSNMAHRCGDTGQGCGDRGRAGRCGCGMGDVGRDGRHRKGCRDLGKGQSDRQEELAGQGSVTRQS